MRLAAAAGELPDDAEERVAAMGLEPTLRDRTLLLIEQTRMLAERAAGQADTSDHLRAAAGQAGSGARDDRQARSDARENGLTRRESTADARDDTLVAREGTADTRERRLDHREQSAELHREHLERRDHVADVRAEALGLRRGSVTIRPSEPWWEAQPVVSHGFCHRRRFRRLTTAVGPSEPVVTHGF